MAVDRVADSFQNSKSEDNSEDDLFYFESDHLALKGNKDYSEVMKTLFILEAQRTRAIKDYEKVVELREEALRGPIEFVEKLKNGESLGVPDLQVITEVPAIEWSKYQADIPEEGLKFINATSKPSINFSTVANNLKRVETRNKQWTTEEQRRLEELLVIYPSEGVELQRFKKIAAALGNRTVKQVSSRVQKYFLKLYKAGLPIPGRVPKYAEKFKKSKLHNHQRHNHYLFKPTTFFPQLDLPVTMNESEEIPGPSVTSESHTKSSNYLIPSSSHTYEEEINGESDDYLDLQIQILEKVKSEMLKSSSQQFTYTHVGFTCVCCKNVIEGVRWHCKSCEPISVNYCSSCIVFQIHSNNSHPIIHKLVVIRGTNTLTNTKVSESSNDSKLTSVRTRSQKSLVSSNDASVMDTDEEFDETNSSSESNDTDKNVIDKCTNQRSFPKFSSQYSNFENLSYQHNQTVQDIEEVEDDNSNSELFLLSEDSFKYLSESLQDVECTKTLPDR